MPLIVTIVYYELTTNPDSLHHTRVSRDLVDLVGSPCFKGWEFKALCDGPGQYSQGEKAEAGQH